MKNVICSTYHFRSFSGPEVVARYLKKVINYLERERILNGLEFDAIVVTGLSGVVMGSLVAHALGKQLTVVRSQGVDSHAEVEVEGFITEHHKYIVLDDIVCTGKTMTTIFKAMEKASDTVDYEHRAECVHAVLYSGENPFSFAFQGYMPRKVVDETHVDYVVPPKAFGTAMVNGSTFKTTVTQKPSTLQFLNGCPVGPMQIPRSKSELSRILDGKIADFLCRSVVDGDLKGGTNRPDHFGPSLKDLKMKVKYVSKEYNSIVGAFTKAEDRTWRCGIKPRYVAG